MGKDSIVDLHVHTTASDGVLRPREIVKKAGEMGISALGICDHDTVAGVKEALDAGKDYAVEVLAGIELSTLYEHKDLHILGYFIEHTNKKLLEKLGFLASKRAERAAEVVKKLQYLGYRITFDSVLKKAQGAPIGKPHIVLSIFDEPDNRARLDEEFQDVPTVGNFIQKYLEFGGDAYVPKVKIQVSEAIDMVHEHNGVAVLAHPGFDVDLNDEGAELIKLFTGWGLEGLEVLSFIENWDKTKTCMEFFTHCAQANSLLITGGSDYHGYTTGEAENIGSDLGFENRPMKITYDYFEKLKNYHKYHSKRI